MRVQQKMSGPTIYEQKKIQFCRVQNVYLVANADRYYYFYYPSNDLSLNSAKRWTTTT